VATVRLRSITLTLHTTAWCLMIAFNVAASLGYLSDDFRHFGACFVFYVVPMLGLLAFVTGLTSMILCEPRKESVTLAVTTLAGLLLALGSLTRSIL
jgi:hypothetical protein